MSPILSLLTDFGLADPYVGEMKARILELAPHARIVDLSHGVSPGRIRSGAYVLERAATVFPSGSIHLAVVDPGVGTPRRALALHAGDQYFVGPDNGLFAGIWERQARPRGVALKSRRVVGERSLSRTFHGRDLFAPAAARLARGDALDALGDPITDLIRSDRGISFEHDLIRAPVVWIDHFGNLITELRAEELPADPRFELAGREIVGLRETFADVESGAALAYVGSGGTLELALRDHSLARSWGVRLDQEVHVWASAGDR